MKRKTLKEFINKANTVHNFFYDYSKFILVNYNTNGIIICPDHGFFLQIPKSHLLGHGCLKCSGKQKHTIDTFIKAANIIHNFKYDYSKFKILKRGFKDAIICPEHGEFFQDFRAHLKGHGCSKCSGNFKLTLEYFIQKSNKIHNFKYDYSKFILKSSTDSGIIICPIHGEFNKTPNSHLCGQGCQKCSKLNNKLNNKLKMTLFNFINRANIIHNFKYDYSKFINIKNNKSKGVIICPYHGEFKQSQNHHLSGHGCPKCLHSISKAETEWLNYLNIQENLRHKVIKIHNKKYNLDAYNPQTNTIYEFYGDFWHGNLIKFDKNKIHPIRKITYGELYSKTIQREKELKDAGYNLVTIWESEWNEIQKQLKKEAA